MNRTVAGFLAALALMFAQSRPPDYAIVNARIVVSPEKVIPSGVIVVRNGLIEAISEGSPPPEARVFDARGLTVYTGLIDAASNYGFPAPPPRTGGTAPGTGIPPASPAP